LCESEEPLSLSVHGLWRSGFICWENVFGWTLGGLVGNVSLLLPFFIGAVLGLVLSHARNESQGGQ
jgi:hypothetical protein